MIIDLKRSIDLRWLLMFGAIFILKRSCFRKKWNLVPTICSPNFSSEFSNKNIFLGTAYKHTLMGSSSRLEQIRTFSEFKNGWFPSSYHFVPNIFYQIFVANIVLRMRIMKPTWHLPQHPSSHPTLRSKPFKFILKIYSDIKVEQTKNLSHAPLEFFCCI